MLLPDIKNCIICQSPLTVKQKNSAEWKYIECDFCTDPVDFDRLTNFKYFYAEAEDAQNLDYLEIHYQDYTILFYSSSDDDQCFIDLQKYSDPPIYFDNFPISQNRIPRSLTELQSLINSFVNLQAFI